VYVKLSDYIVSAKLTNSLVNPLIYAITTAQFRHSLRALAARIFSCCLCTGIKRMSISQVTASTSVKSREQQ
jgi:hypothetical protein